jgi:hypothetical protein
MTVLLAPKVSEVCSSPNAQHHLCRSVYSNPLLPTSSIERLGNELTKTIPEPRPAYLYLFMLFKQRTQSAFFRLTINKSPPCKKIEPWSYGLVKSGYAGLNVSCKKWTT